MFFRVGQSLVVRGFFLFGAVSVFGITLVGCGDDGGGGSTEPSLRNIVPSQPSAARAFPWNEGAPGRMPTSATCDPATPVVCPSGCCPEGTTCGAGACVVPGVQRSCADPSAVRCEIPAACSGSVCTSLDSSSHGNDMRITAPAAFAPGRWGSGVVTNDAPAMMGVCNPHIEASTSGFPASNAPITLEAWVKARASGGTESFQYVMSLGSAACGAERSIAIVTVGGLATVHFPSDCAANCGTSQRPLLLDGNWP